MIFEGTSKTTISQESCPRPSEAYQNSKPCLLPPPHSNTLTHAHTRTHTRTHRIHTHIVLSKLPYHFLTHTPVTSAATPFRVTFLIGYAGSYTTTSHPIAFPVPYPPAVAMSAVFVHPPLLPLSSPLPPIDPLPLLLLSLPLSLHLSLPTPHTLSPLLNPLPPLTIVACMRIT